MLTMTSRLVFLFLVAVRGTLGCFINKTSSISIKTGDTFYQECYCIENGTVDSLRWVDPEGKEVDLIRPGSESVVFAEKSGLSLSLFIAYVSKSRGGTYSCVADLAGQVHALNYNIRAYDPLYFVDPVKAQFLIKGQDSVIKCEARGETQPVINWYKGTGDDMIQVYEEEKYEQVPEGLKVKQVADDDEGVYRCTALVPETSEEQEQIITVEVLTKPVIKGVVVKPDRAVVIGDALSMECIGIGVPTLEYRWNKTSEKGPKRAGEWPKPSNKLVFDSVKADDRGVYECVASNRAGTATEAITIEVLIPPKIETFKNVTGSEGSIVHIICNASGRPSPTIKIEFEKDFDQAEISVVNLNVSQTENSLVVTFFNLSRRYDGAYFCNATNQVDTVNAAATVSVHHRPYFDSIKELFWGWNGITLTLTCASESNPPAEIQWWYQVNSSWPDVELGYLKNEKHFSVTIEDDNPAYGTYKCIASNYIGNSTKHFMVKPAFKPSVVTNCSVSETTPSSVTFDIEAPQDYHGPDVIGFISEYDETGNYERTSIHYNRTWAVNVTYKVEKLKPMTKYRFKFAAINAKGNGNWSESMDVETPEKSAPDQPTAWVGGDAADGSHDGNLIVRWKTPENNGEPIDLYFLQYCLYIGEELDEGNCNIVEIASFSTEFDLTGLLQSDRTYEILLAAHNALGNSTGAQLLLTVPISVEPTVSAELMIGLSVLAVVVGVLAVDLLLFMWRRQGLIATCYYRTNKKTDDNTLSRDKKGLLRENDPSAAEDTLKRERNGEKSYEYPRTTGIITGKHSAV